MRDSQGGGESDPTEDVHSAARRILLPFYPAEVRGQKKAVTVAAKSRQFAADNTGKCAEMARKIPREARPSGRPQSFGIW